MNQVLIFNDLICAGFVAREREGERLNIYEVSKLISKPTKKRTTL